MFGTPMATTTGNNASTVSYPEWTQAFNQAVANAGFNILSPQLQTSPFQVAGLNPDQMQAFDLTRDMTLGAFAGPNQNMQQAIGNLMGSNATMQAAQAGPAATMQAAQAGPAAMMRAAQAGPATTMRAAQAGPAAMMRAAQAGPAAMMRAAQAGPATQAMVTNASAAQLGGGDFTQFMNPFNQAVIDATMRNMTREKNRNSAEIGARAAAAGSFGGSREAVQRANLDRNFADQASTMVAQLLSAGYDRATANALANTQMRQQAGLQNASAANQIGLSNMNAQNQMRQFDASAFNDANARNMAALNNMMQFDVGARNDANARNMAALNNMAQFDVGARNDANARNMAALNNMTQFDVGARNDANARNMAALNNMTQFDVGARNDANARNMAARNALMQYNATNQQEANAANALFTQNLPAILDRLQTNQQARQTNALQALLGVGNQQQAFAQTALDTPLRSLERLMGMAPNVYNTTETGTSARTAPTGAPSVGQQLFGFGLNLLRNPLGKLLGG